MAHLGTAVLLAALVAAASASASLHFLAFGDWGGSGSAPYTTKGEVATAAAAAKVAQTLNSSFLLALGDNFYSEGVKNEYDTRFQTTFEHVFTQDSLQMPWYVLAGNHDHYGNVTAQIAYSQHSPRWTFPSEYYTFTKTLGDVSLQFVMIDTVILAGNSHFNDGSYPEEGPADVQMAESQWDWIEATLKASTADYIITAGHYPVWSICEHGPTKILVDRLKPLLEQYKASAYICGHDHCQEHIHEDGNPVNYFVVGAAHGCDSSTVHEHSVPSGSLRFHWASGLGGFSSFTLSAANLTIDVYDTTGTVLYTQALTPRH